MSEKVFNTRIQMKHDTTANWSRTPRFVPKSGEIVVYDDYATVDGVAVPNFKIGDGISPGADLPFVSDDLRAEIEEHIRNMSIHITDEERSFWNNKARVDGDPEDGLIVFTIH